MPDALRLLAIARLIADIDPKPEVPLRIEPVAPAAPRRAPTRAIASAFVGPVRSLPTGVCRGLRGVASTVDRGLTLGVSRCRIKAHRQGVKAKRECSISTCPIGSPR